MELNSGETIVHGSQVNWKKQLEGHNQIGQPATLTRIESLEKFGWPDPSIIFKRNNDWDMWCRAYTKGANFHFIDEVLVTEHGLKLQDSLGRSVDDLTDIALLMSKESRVLRPDKIKDRSIYSWPRAASKSQRQLILLAFAKHHLRTRSWNQFIESSDSELQELFHSLGIEKSRIEYNLLIIAAEQLFDIGESNATLKLEIMRKQNYIDQQQEFIDSQVKLIESYRESHLPNENNKCFKKIAKGIRIRLRGILE